MAPVFRTAAIVASALLWAAGSISLAEEAPAPAIFLGELRSITLIRPDRQREPNADGVMVISNSCGEETAVLRVVRSTAPLESPQELHFRLSEWCDLPIVFEESHWLIVTDSGADATVLPVFESGAIAFGVVRDERRLSEAVRQRLVLQRLPEPVLYPYEIDLDSSSGRRFVRGQSSLEIRNGQVWVVKGVLLSALFPDLAESDLY